MPKPKDYIWIEAWGKHMGSYPGFIAMEQELAAAQNAPLDSIRRSEGAWETTDVIMNEDVRRQLNLPPLAPALRFRHILGVLIPRALDTIRTAERDVHELTNEAAHIVDTMTAERKKDKSP